jgi:hypothetical protein
MLRTLISLGLEYRRGSHTGHVDSISGQLPVSRQWGRQWSRDCLVLVCLVMFNPSKTGPIRKLSARASRRGHSVDATRALVLKDSSQGKDLGRLEVVGYLASFGSER